MAVTQTLNETVLRATYKTGVDTFGKDVMKTQKVIGLVPDASDDSLLVLANVIGANIEHPIDEVIKSSVYELKRTV